MGFSMRLAPGVRVRVSSRGVRTSLGPKVARVHIGAGRSGVSTGIGTFNTYSSIGGSNNHGNRKYSQNSSRAAIVEAERHERTIEKNIEHEILQASLGDIYTLHQTSFKTAESPKAHFIEPDTLEVYRKYTDAAKASVHVLSINKRRQAVKRAKNDAEVEINRLRVIRREKQGARQKQLDEWWKALMKCDEGTVLEELNRAFADNYAIAAATGVVGGEASVIVVIRDEKVIPDRIPTKTNSGRLSSKKMSNNSKTFFYLNLVTGSILVTVREALAVIPGLESIRIIAIRESIPDVYGKRLPEVIATSRFERESLNGVQWKAVNAIDIFNQCGDEQMIKQHPRTNKIIPLNLAEEDNIRQILAKIDMSELLGR